MKAKLIAEPAIYWRGEIQLLYHMVDIAAAAQCDFFKYQCFNPDRLSAAFQPRKKFYSQCQLSVPDLASLKERVEKTGMEFLVTMNTPDRVELLRELNVTNIKVASGQIHPSLFEAIGRHYWKRIMISTGMLDKAEKLDLIHTVSQMADEIVVFHCVSLYPHYDCETNLGRLNTLRSILGDKYKYGYSDHSMDDVASIGAVAMGAEYIERHFKVEACYGPTSQVCCDGKELATLGTALRRLSAIMGDGKIEMQDREWESFNHYKNRFLL